MSTTSKTIAKSLHTVSVLVNVAKHLQDTVPGYGTDPHFAAAAAVDGALRVLGYADASDPYGLAAKAVAVLEAGK